MKPVLFCSFLIPFLAFSCKPKPLDNLKELARQDEENKVKRVSRAQLAQETQRICDNVLVQVLSARQAVSMTNAAADTLCNFRDYAPYQQFQEKYKGRAQLLTDPNALKKLTAEMEELRKYRNELPENTGQFPATFQTLNDTLLYVREVEEGQTLCAAGNANAAANAENRFWVFRLPKVKFVEIMTVKVKPKPVKGPNW